MGKSCDVISTHLDWKRSLLIIYIYSKICKNSGRPFVPCGEVVLVLEVFSQSCWEVLKNINVLKLSTLSYISF